MTQSEQMLLGIIQAQLILIKTLRHAITPQQAKAELQKLKEEFTIGDKE